MPSMPSLARPGSAHTKGRSEAGTDATAGSAKSARRRSHKGSEDGHGSSAALGGGLFGSGGAKLDRHEMMRRAMAEAAREGLGPIAASPMPYSDEEDDEDRYFAPQPPSQPVRRSGSASAAPPSSAVGVPASISAGAPQNNGGGGGGSRSGGTFPTSLSTSSVPAGAAPGGISAPMPTVSVSDATGVGEMPGEGSLSIDAFGRTDAGGIVVLPDGSVMGRGGGGGERPGSSGGAAGTAIRPGLGSRNNSFGSDAGTPGLQQNGTFEGSPSNGRSRNGTPAIVTPDRGRSSNLAPPGDRSASRTLSPSRLTPGSNASRDSAHHMHESQSTSALLSPSPLARLRKLSDAAKPGRSSTADGLLGNTSSPSKKGNVAAGGIAGALAAAGAAGMGVGSASASAHISRSRRNSLTGSVNGSSTTGPSGHEALQAGYQGGVYRDPRTGELVEQSPSPRDEEELEELRKRRKGLREREGSSVSIGGDSFRSDFSASSGLAAAANFSAAVAAQQGLLAPPIIGAPSVASPGGERRASGGGGPGSAQALTPGGIGAVGGLSPSGFGEGVSILDDEHAWPGDVGTQITGFALASSKRNHDFHALFPSVPEDDYLIEDYGCALVREILIQGRIYISENHICFNANIFGWVTNVVVAFSEIVSIEKRMTAFVIPNAIQIATLHSKHTFSSFLSRDTAYDLIVNIWKLSHPAARLQAEAQHALTEDESVDGGDDDDEATVAPAEKKAKKGKKLKKLGKKEKAALAAASAKADANEAPNPNDDGTSAATVKAGSSAAAEGGKRAPHRRTSCPCDKDKKHYSTVVLDSTYPTVPEKMYNLLFTSGFMKDFWTGPQKLTDLQMSDWAPDAGNNNMLSRSLSYIKPLTGSFGPKQTKCVITDENLHVDFDDYVTTLTTTKTPEVPSGGSFMVRTRTCFTWAGGNNTRIYVTCAVEWTGRSMIKGIIDKASIDGQKAYYSDLDAELRKYIKEHTSEFKEEGEDEEDNASRAELAMQGGADSADKDEKGEGAADDGGKGSSANGGASGAGGMLGMLSDLAGGAFDALSGAVGGVGELSPSTLALLGLVVVLALSNIWAVTTSASSSRARDPLDPHRLRSGRASSAASARIDPGSPEAIALAVRGALQDYLEPARPLRFRSGLGGGAVAEEEDEERTDPYAEAKAIRDIIADVEARLDRLKSGLADVGTKGDAAAAAAAGSKGATTAQAGKGKKAK